MRRPCPECKRPIKESNLGNHLARAHPDVPRRTYRKLGIEKPRPENRTPWATYAIVLAIVAVVTGVLFSSSPGPEGTPQFLADHTTFDFGHVPQGVSEHVFPIRNAGDGTLKIFDIQSSCGCTGGHMVIGGVEGPHFGMHDRPQWEGVIAPGSTAQLVVTYDATAHEDLYNGPRSVYLRTNDPSRSEVEFVIHVHEG